MAGEGIGRLGAHIGISVAPQRTLQGLSAGFVAFDPEARAGQGPHHEGGLLQPQQQQGDGPILRHLPQTRQGRHGPGGVTGGDGSAQSGDVRARF